MKTIVSVLLSFICFSYSFSQIASNIDAVGLSKRVLLVGLEEPNEKKLKKMSADEADSYKLQIEGNNSTLKKAVEKHWKLTKEIQYMPLSEATALLKSNEDKYAVLRYEKYREYENFTSGAGWSRNSSGSLSYNTGVRYSEIANEIMCLKIYMPHAIHTLNLPNFFVSESDAVYAVLQLQYLFSKLLTKEKYRTVDIVKECNGDILKKKTLLINKQDIDQELKDNDIAKVYPHKFKIVSTEEIDKAIVELDSAFVIIQIVGVQVGKGNLTLHFLSETNTGCIVGNIVASTSSARVSENILKNYSVIANCKKK